MRNATFFEAARCTRARPAGLLAALAMTVTAAAAGCAKTPTVVATDVTTDATVPPLLVLRLTVAREAQPDVRASSSFQSTVAGDAADRPAPLPFPLRLPISVDSSIGSPVIITIEGLDWDDRTTVLAAGTTTAIAIPEQQTSAAVALKGGALTCGDGTLDPGERCDDGNHTAGDGCNPFCLTEPNATDGGVTTDGATTD